MKSTYHSVWHIVITQQIASIANDNTNNMSYYFYRK